MHPAAVLRENPAIFALPFLPGLTCRVKLHGNWLIEGINQGGELHMKNTQLQGAQMKDLSYAEIPYVGKKLSRIF